MTGSNRRCFVIDGGTGADRIAALRARDVQIVDSPRHANLLLVIEPVSEALAGAVSDAWRAMPQSRSRATLGPNGEIIDVQSAEPHAIEIEPLTVDLPPKEKREMATELAVIVLGPLQQMTAGPLRITLVCDGEQVVRADVQRGFAARGIAAKMRGRTLAEATELSRQIAPLAPIASQAAFEHAIGHESDDHAAISIERARSHLSWTERFATLTGIEWLAGAARIARSAADVEKVLRRVERERLLRIRFRGVGKITAPFLEERGVTGPLLDASRSSDGDVLARLSTRLREAAEGLRSNAGGGFRTARGDLSVEASLDGGRLSDVTWRAPSAPLIDLIPDVVRDQKLADAEAIIASLDIATAEVDG